MEGNITFLCVNRDRLEALNFSANRRWSERSCPFQNKMAAPSSKKRAVLFICLGNICRSTMAEGILQHLVAQTSESDKWLIDSAATADYNIGRPPDNRTMATLKKNGITGYNHTARLLTDEDYNKFDVIFGMDDENMADLQEMKPAGKCRAQLQMLGDLDPQKDRIIVDPYFTSGMAPFDKVYDQCLRCLTAFLKQYSTSVPC